MSYYMKFCIRIIGVVVAMYSLVASGYASEVSAINNIAHWLHYVISLLSWLRIILASIAWKLMTNDLVFGWFMHMDIYLFKIHTVIRNIANYWLGFGFLAMIWSQIFSSDIDIGWIVKKIGAFMFAGILINISMFAVQALVDISTLATITASNMAQSFIGNNETRIKNIVHNGARQQQVTYTADGTIEYNKNTTDNDVRSVLDTLMPNQHSVWWSLVYLGSSVLHMQNYSLLKHITDEWKDFSTLTAGKNITIGFILQLGVIAIFSISLLVLIIANVVRIGMIRVLTAMWPLLFLIRWLGRWWVKLPSWISEIAEKNFSMSGFLSLIFLPVFNVLMMGIIVIITSTMMSFLYDNPNISHNSTHTNESNLSINEVISLTYEWNFLSDSKHVFSDLILTVLTLALMWNLAILSIPSKTPIVGWIAKNIRSLAKDYLLSRQILPVPWMGTMSMWWLQHATSYKNRGMLNPLTHAKTLQRTFDKKSEESAQNLVKKLTWQQDERFTRTTLDDMFEKMGNDPSNANKSSTFFTSFRQNMQNFAKEHFAFSMDRFSDERILLLAQSIKNDRSHTASNNWTIDSVDELSSFFNDKTIVNDFVTYFMEKSWLTLVWSMPSNYEWLKRAEFKKK